MHFSCARGTRSGIIHFHMLDLKLQRLLVIAPHPDDEVLGCGGLINKVKEAGGEVYVLYLTVGTTKDYSKVGISTTNQRLNEIKKVARFLRFDDFKIAFPGDKYHLQLDKIPQKKIISIIENSTKISLNKIRPTIIATTQPIDYNQDHRAAAQAVFAATRPVPSHLKPFQNIVLGYEFAPTSWTAAPMSNPNFFIKLSTTNLAAKVKAMDLYRSQKRNGHHARSAQTIRSLARIRGVVSGTSMAEAFYCYRFFI